MPCHKIYALSFKLRLLSNISLLSFDKACKAPVISMGLERAALRSILLCSFVQEIRQFLHAVDPVHSMWIGPSLPEDH
jgi:hypothetical protein